MSADLPADLVALAVNGDEEALSTLLQRHGPIVRGQIAAQIGAKWQNVLDADDVMQVTYLEAFLRVERLQPRGEEAFAGWLSQIARNNLRDAIDELSRLKRPPPDQRVVATGDESAVQLMEKLGCTTTTPSRHAGRREVQQAVEQAIDRLPEDYATVIRAYDLEGLPITEVAARLGRSEGAVYMLRARAHDRLREAFGEISTG